MPFPRYQFCYSSKKYLFISEIIKALAVDEAQYGVRVNSISPGNVLTPLWQNCANLTPDPVAAVQSGCDQQLLGRMATPQEVGEACLFLAAEGTFCTGIG